MKGMCFLEEGSVINAGNGKEHFFNNFSTNGLSRTNGSQFIMVQHQLQQKKTEQKINMTSDFQMSRHKHHCNLKQES